MEKMENKIKELMGEYLKTDDKIKKAFIIPSLSYELKYYIDCLSNDIIKSNKDDNDLNCKIFINWSKYKFQIENEYDEALIRLDKAEEFSEKTNSNLLGEINYLKARCYTKLGKYELALNHINKAFDYGYCTKEEAGMDLSDILCGLRLNI